MYDGRRGGVEEAHALHNVADDGEEEVLRYVRIIIIAAILQ